MGPGLAENSWLKNTCKIIYNFLYRLKQISPILTYLKCIISNIVKIKADIPHFDLFEVHY